MCRYVVYLGRPIALEDIVYRPANSLVHQASEAMESPTRINADGFGVGWYSPENHPEPVVFKDITPAWNNANLGSLAGKIDSGCILAHVRAAQRYDPVTRDNCHPFQHHRLLFMHNGDIPGRGRLVRRVLGEVEDDELVARIRGNTDSELAFTLFLSRLPGPLDRTFDALELATALEETLVTLAGWHRDDADARPLVMNFCVTDGRSLVASRFARQAEVPSLHYGIGDRYLCKGGVCRIEPVSGQAPGPGCVMVASETLSEDSRWQDIPASAMVTVHADLTVEQRPLPI